VTASGEPATVPLWESSRVYHRVCLRPSRFFGWWHPRPLSLPPTCPRTCPKDARTRLHRPGS